MANYKVAILGMGYVGKALKELVQEHFDVVSYDPKYDKRYPSSEIDECEMAIVCVPTPSLANGECDTSIVESTVARLNSKHILLRSTVPPGTTDRLREENNKYISFAPVYIGESTYYNPIYPSMKETEFLVVGGVMRKPIMCVMPWSQSSVRT